MSAPPPKKLAFGLNKAALPRVAPKKLPGKSLFSAGGDDDDDEPPPPPGSHLGGSRPRVSTASLTKAQKAKQKAEVELNSSVYEYDEVYDNMKAAEKMAVDKRKHESSDLKVRPCSLCEPVRTSADRRSVSTAQVHQPPHGDCRVAQARPATSRG
jgi:hypothetical protein